MLTVAKTQSGTSERYTHDFKVIKSTDTDTDTDTKTCNWRHLSIPANMDAKISKY